MYWARYFDEDLERDKKTVRDIYGWNIYGENILKKCGVR